LTLGNLEKKLRKISMENSDVFCCPENPLANHCYQMLFGEKKISFKESLYGKKSPQRIRISNVKNDHG